MVYYAQEESVIIKIIVIILKEKPWNNQNQIKSNQKKV